MAVVGWVVVRNPAVAGQVSQHCKVEVAVGKGDEVAAETDARLPKPVMVSRLPLEAM